MPYHACHSRLSLSGIQSLQSRQDGAPTKVGPPCRSGFQPRSVFIRYPPEPSSGRCDTSATYIPPRVCRMSDDEKIHPTPIWAFAACSRKSIYFGALYCRASECLRVRIRSLRKEGMKCSKNSKGASAPFFVKFPINAAFYF